MLLGTIRNDDFQRNTALQQELLLAMMEQCCNHSKQCRNNAVVLFCTEKND